METFNGPRHRATSKYRRSISVVAGVIAGVVFLSGGGASGAVKRSAPKKAAKSSAVIAEFRKTGGKCRRGICNSVMSVQANGVVSYKGDDKVKGFQLSPKQAATFKALVEATATDPETLPKFTGTCPTAIDGPERIFVLRRKAGVRTFAECSVQIPQSGVFLELEDLWNTLFDE
jgi:hypothetical protein